MNPSEPGLQPGEIPNEQGRRDWDTLGNQNTLMGVYILWLHVGNQEDKKWETKQNTVLVLEKHLSELPAQL